MTQGKKQLTIFLVFLTIVLTAFWILKGSLAHQEHSVPVGSEANDSFFGDFFTTSERPMSSEAPTSARITSKEEAPTSPKPSVSSQESVNNELPTPPVSLPLSTAGLVTEFRDAFLVTLPDQVPNTTEERKETAPTEKPAYVTGFAGTLPLSLPLTTPSTVKSEEMRAVFVASAYNLDFPSRPALSTQALQGELDAIVAQTKRLGLNTIIFQVRPCSDALYASDLFPTSRFLAASEGGAMPLDALAYLIEKAHCVGIAVHAWINPFRVSQSKEGLSSLSFDNPAKKEPQLTFSVPSGIYYNPALSAVHDLVISGVYEIVSRYDVDGILFDDYFYPDDVGLVDFGEYQRYLNLGGRLSLGDWRRENINRLIERTYQTIKSCRKGCLFGVSPRGVWRNATDDPKGSDTLGGAAYDEIFCDALAWVKGGYLDYLSPQIYWRFDNSAAPFGTLADWWNEALKDSGVTLVVALAPYSLPKSEIEKQVTYLKTLSQANGYALFRYASLSDWQ